MQIGTQSCMSSQGPRSKFLEWGAIFGSVIFVKLFFVKFIFIFAKKVGRGGGGFSLYAVPGSSNCCH